MQKREESSRKVRGRGGNPEKTRTSRKSEIPERPPRERIRESRGVAGRKRNETEKRAGRERNLVQNSQERDERESQRGK